MLEAVNVSMAFGGRTILDSVSLRLQPGERCALLGSSGSGKTTLLRILAGILRPDSGSIACNDVFRRFDDRQDWHDWIWPTVTLVFQDIRLFPNLSGLLNCTVGGTDIGLASVYALAKQLRVDHCLNRRPHQMSQGEQQRITIMRALLRRPTFLLMDEPTSALDSSLQEEIALAINELPDIVAVLVATHDLAFAASVAKSYLALREGKLLRADTLHEAVDLVAGSARKIK